VNPAAKYGKRPKEKQEEKKPQPKPPLPAVSSGTDDHKATRGRGKDRMDETCPEQTLQEFLLSALETAKKRQGGKKIDERRPNYRRHETP